MLYLVWTTISRVDHARYEVPYAQELGTCIWRSCYNSSFCATGIKGMVGGVMVLGKLPVPRRPTIWITVGQGPAALAVGAGGGCLDIFILLYLFSFSLSLGDGPIKTELLSQRAVKPKTTNQPATGINVICATGKNINSRFRFKIKAS